MAEVRRSENRLSRAFAAKGQEVDRDDLAARILPGPPATQLCASEVIMIGAAHGQTAQSSRNWSKW